MKGIKDRGKVSKLNEGFFAEHTLPILYNNVVILALTFASCLSRVLINLHKKRLLYSNTLHPFNGGSEKSK
jgi:hypothetical protein